MASPEIKREIWLPASPAEVWTALTRDEQLSEWFGADVELEPRLGGRARFRFADGSAREAVVETFAERRAMVLRWMPFARDVSGRTMGLPATVVSFTMEPGTDGTLLRVRESLPGRSGLGPQPDEPRDPQQRAARARSRAGS